MAIKKIGILGAGIMGGGSGIAHLAAVTGFEVVLYCVEWRFVESAVKRISGLFDRRIEKKKMTFDEKEAALKLIKITTHLDDFASVDMVIETIYFDDIEIKKLSFEKIDKICGPEVIFCSNTTNIQNISDMSISDLASATSRPSKVVGLKFLNPPQITRQVEVIRGYHTSDETLALVTEALQAMGKKAILSLSGILGLGDVELNIPVEKTDIANRLGGNYPIDSSKLVFSEEEAPR